MRKFTSIVLFGSALSLLLGCQKEVINAPPTESITLSANTNGQEITVAAIPTNSYYIIDSLGKNIQFFSEYYSANYEQNRLQSNYKLSDFLPTGFYVKPNQQLKILVQQVSGTTLPKLLIGTYARTGINSVPQEVQLVSGLNQITSNDKGGILWIRYGHDSSPSAQVKITFQSGHEKVPMFIKNKTDAADFVSQLNTAPAEVNDALLIGQYTYVVLQKTQSTLKTQNNNSAIEKLDTYWKSQDDLIGLDSSSAIHRPLQTPQLLTICVPAYAGGFVQNYVAATSYSVQDNYLSVSRHEFGHLHQQSWTTQPEPMGQFFTVASGIDANMPIDKYIEGFGNWANIWPAVNDYFSKPDSVRDFDKFQSTSVPNLTGGGFLGAAMLIQLRYAYGNDFIKTLNKITRQNKPVFLNKTEKYQYLMVKACIISGFDLSQFFNKWGFKYPAAYVEIAALGLPTPTTDPSTYTDTNRP